MNAHKIGFILIAIAAACLILALLIGPGPVDLMGQRKGVVTLVVVTIATWLGALCCWDHASGTGARPWWANRQALAKLTVLTLLLATGFAMIATETDDAMIDSLTFHSAFLFNAAGILIWTVILDPPVGGQRRGATPGTGSYRPGPESNPPTGSACCKYKKRC